MQADLEFPFAFGTPTEPAPQFARLRAEEPVAKVRLPSGDRAWLVTGYPHVRRVLSDERFSRAAATAPDAPRLGPVRPDPASLMAMDPPAHTRLRRLVAPAFMSHAVDRLRPRVERIAKDLLDAVAASGAPADLVAGLARPLPFAVLEELLGVPRTDRERFRAWTTASLRLGQEAGTEVVAARAELAGYLTTLVESRYLDPGDDLLSDLTAAQHRSDLLDREELVALAGTLLTAGYHTVASAIANGGLVLLRHPAQTRVLRHRPDLIPRAVEELLRFTPGPVSGGTMRVCTTDTVVGEVTIRAGEGVIPATSSANRDALVFTAPDRFDVERSGNPHLAFGHGPHRCIGASLARMELRAAFGALLRRFPDLRLAVPEEQLEWELAAMIRSVHALPVAW